MGINKDFLEEYPPMAAGAGAGDKDTRCKKIVVEGFFVSCLVSNVYFVTVLRI